MDSVAPIDLLLEQWVTEEGAELDLRARRRAQLVVELEPLSVVRAAPGRPLSVEPRGGPAEHLVVADVTQVVRNAGDEVDATLATDRFTGILVLRAPHEALASVVPRRRVAVRCRLRAEPPEPDRAFPALTRTWHVASITHLVDGHRSEVDRTRHHGREGIDTYLVACTPLA